MPVASSSRLILRRAWCVTIHWRAGLLQLLWVVFWSSGCSCEGCGRGGAPPHLFLTFFFSFATSLMFTSEERSACKKRVSGPGLAKPRSGRWLRTRAASVRYRGAPAAQYQSLAAAVAAAT